MVPASVTGSGDVLVSFDDVWKSFGGRPAVAGVSLQLRAGQVVGLVGPNGAGKSTLVKLLDGVYSPDRGQIATADGGDVRDIVGVVHQELGVIDILSITENVRLGVPGSRRARVFLRRVAEREEAAAAMRRVGLDVDPDQHVGSLSTAEKSLLAVARLLTRNRRVIVVDETTAALPAESATWLLDRLRALAAEGASIVVVSHRLGEIIEACDRLVVLIDGTVSLDRSVAGLDAADIADAMSSGKIAAATRRRAAPAASVAAEPRLRLAGVSGRGIRDVSLELNAGEILGLTGPVGSGLHEVARIAAGVTKPDRGQRQLPRNYRVAFLPPDRRREALMLDQPIHWNATLASLHRYQARGFLNLRREREDVRDICDRIGVNTTGIDQLVRELSGGNQQKVLIGRVVLDRPDVVILCEPTIGVDVHTRAEIYALIDELKASGAAILLASSDLEEVLAISDRLGVVRRDGVHILAETDAHDRSSLKELAM